MVVWSCNANNRGKAKSHSEIRNQSKGTHISLSLVKERYAIRLLAAPEKMQDSRGDNVVRDLMDNIVPSVDLQSVHTDIFSNVHHNIYWKISWIFLNPLK